MPEVFLRVVCCGAGNLPSVLNNIMGRRLKRRQKTMADAKFLRDQCDSYQPIDQPKLVNCLEELPGVLVGLPGAKENEIICVDMRDAHDPETHQKEMAYHIGTHPFTLNQVSKAACTADSLRRIRRMILTRPSSTQRRGDPVQRRQNFVASACTAPCNQPSILELLKAVDCPSHLLGVPQMNLQVYEQILAVPQVTMLFGHFANPRPALSRKRVAAVNSRTFVFGPSWTLRHTMSFILACCGRRAFFNPERLFKVTTKCCDPCDSLSQRNSLRVVFLVKGLAENKCISGIFKFTRCPQSRLWILWQQRSKQGHQVTGSQNALRHN
eukprot:s354_g1.t1